MREREKKEIGEDIERKGKKSYRQNRRKFEKIDGERQRQGKENE